MVTTRAIGKKLENLLEEHGDQVDVSSQFSNARFHIYAKRLEKEINYVAGGPSGFYISLQFKKENGHWGIANSIPDQKCKLLMNKALNVSYQVFANTLNSLSDN